MQAFVKQLEDAWFLDWPDPPVTLCRLDNNITNYVQRPGQWSSVDWEYSDWGDPTFDVANLLTHVSYMEVPPSRWGAYAALYCDLAQDEAALIRIQTYCQILVVWWVVRLARYLYDLPRGLDRRLADWAPNWQSGIDAKYRHHLHLAGLYGGPQAFK